MKTIDLKTESAEQLMNLAQNDSVRVRNAQGQEFLVSPADDFVSEVELLRHNHKFLAFLDARFSVTKRKSLGEVESRMGKEAG